MGPTTTRDLISRDDSAIAWAKRKDALCFPRFVVDRIPTPVLGECIKIIRQGGVDCERNFLRALLELYQCMPLAIQNKWRAIAGWRHGELSQVGGSEKVFQQRVESEPGVN